MGRALDFSLIAIGLAYPFLVYFGLQILPPGFIAIILVGLFAVRIAFRSRQGVRDNLPYLIAAVLVIIVVARSPVIGLKVYPVFLSLSFAGVFGYSLLRPPTVIERIARATHPDLPLEANSYLRKVTIAWLIFFIVNAGISAATALSGNLKLWTIYNGLLSYLVMGMIFAAEFLIRQRVHQRLRRVPA